MSSLYDYVQVISAQSLRGFRALMGGIIHFKLTTKEKWCTPGTLIEGSRERSCLASAGRGARGSKEFGGPNYSVEAIWRKIMALGCR